MNDLEVSWMPGLRPGTTRRYGQCDRDTPATLPISSPVLDSYDIAVVLNQQSLDKFEPR